MNEPVGVYVTYIASTPDKVFKALTDHDATGKFWFGNAATSDWKVGSPIEFHREGKLILSQSRFEHAPKVTHEDLQNSADHAWRMKVEQYWKAKGHCHMEK